MKQLDEHYVNPRLVALYDLENPRGADTDFYVNLASELNAHRIVDLGCGTGLLTREFAMGNREVIGVDPSPAMLDYARQQPNADRVRWIEGDATTLPAVNADLLVMTGNVAQIFLEYADWIATLSGIHRALRPDGYLAFESRNPVARGWEQWNKADSYAKFESPFGMIESWVEVTEVIGDRVHFAGHNVFLATGEDLIVPSELRFRSHEKITDSLKNTGFTVENVYGDWQKGPLLDTSKPMIFIARRNA